MAVVELLVLAGDAQRPQPAGQDPRAEQADAYAQGLEAAVDRLRFYGSDGSILAPGYPP